MTNKYVLDSSALLAVLYKEPGYENILPLLDDSVLSVVNFSETVARIALKGLPLDEITRHIQSVISDIVPFSITTASKAAQLILQTNSFGLSLGDRACIATALEHSYDIITADRIWAKLKLPVKVIVVR